MKKSIKMSLIVITLALMGCVVVFFFRSRPDERLSALASDTSQGPAFEVRVVVPRGGLPLFGIFPDWFVKKHDLTPRELRFDHTSSGAKSGNVGHDRLELSADGWDLSIETDGQGQVAPGTRLVFRLPLGGRQVRLNCITAARATGYLSTATRAGSDVLDGNFVVELAICKNAESGKTTNWPPAPLTVRGSFVGLPQTRR